MSEREQLSERLRVAVEGASTGGGSVFLLTGESGIGRTTLLRAVAAEVGERVRVLWGACDDVAEPRRLGPLRDAGWSAELDYPGFLTELGSEPTALLIDDIQWADDATLDLLGYLARRVTDYPLVVVLTLRDDLGPLSARLHRWLGTLAAAGAQRMPLAPLSLGAIRTLAAESEAAPERLAALTGGNPFYLTELLAADPSGEVVPGSVRDVVLSRLVLVSVDCRAALEQLAVLPGAIDLDLAEELVGAASGVLAEAELRGLLEIGPDGIVFRHEIVRLAIEQGLPGLSRRRLHKTALDVQARKEERHAARLAHHAIAAADRDAITRYAPRAGREAAAAGRHSEALRLFEAAWQQGIRSDELADGYAWALFNAYRFEEAVEVGRRETDLFRHFAGDDAGTDSLERLYHQARWDDLVVQLDEPVAASNVPEQDRREIIRCLLHFRRGQWSPAEATLTAVLNRVGGPNLLQACADPALARLLVRRGEADVVLQGAPAYVVPALVEQAFLAGDVQQLEALRAQWRVLEDEPVWAEIQRYCARAGLLVEPDDRWGEPWLLGAQGDWTGAAEAWARLGDTYEQALELADSGESETMLEAVRLLDALGARPAADLVRRRLRRMGLRVVPRGPSAATRANPVGLTSRQSDVLDLLVDGLTNAEIAEKLVLSVRTVDHHVSAILTRLGVSSRREVGAALRTRSAVA